MVQAQEAGAAEGGNTATVIVQADGSRANVRTITFSAPISGVTALLTAGYDAVVADTSFGPAVCAIEGAGCPAENCFCNETLFWNYNYFDGEAWQGYEMGASQSVIETSGAVEGWRWGEFGSPQIAVEQALAAQSGLAWLATQQDGATGGYGDMGSAVEVMFALAANGQRAADLVVDGQARSLADFTRFRSAKFSRSSAASAGKLAVALSGAAACTSFLAKSPADYLDDAGLYSSDSGVAAWAILGALAQAEPAPADAIAALLAAQQADGGWEWMAGFGADTNTTALVVQALIATETDAAPAVEAALAYFRTALAPSGGFAYAASTLESGADANSTAYVVQALYAAGEDPAGAAWAAEEGTPIGYLLAAQLEDGSFAWQPGTGANLLATAQAIPALLGQPYPFVAEPSPTCTR
jgi:hypothetical protein